MLSLTEQSSKLFHIWTHSMKKNNIIFDFIKQSLSQIEKNSINFFRKNYCIETNQRISRID